MPTPVNADLRGRRRATTEAAIVAAASELFVAQGYAGTSLSQVADAAGVAARTVYVRFGTKAAVLARAVGVAIVGDLEPVPVADRSWVLEALSAATAARRLEVFAQGAADLFARAGALLAVAVQAEPVEPEIAQASQAGRRETHRQHQTFWEAMVRDGLLHRDADVAWLSDTSTLLGSADTYVQMTRVYGWSVPVYHRWLLTTLTRLSVAATP